MFASLYIRSRCWDVGKVAMPARQSTEISGTASR